MGAGKIAKKIKFSEIDISLERIRANLSHYLGKQIEEQKMERKRRKAAARMQRRPK